MESILNDFIDNSTLNTLVIGDEDSKKRLKNKDNLIHNK